MEIFRHQKKADNWNTFGPRSVSILSIYTFYNSNLDVDLDNPENFDDECSSNDANQSYVSNDSNESLVNTSFHKSVFTQRTLSTSSSNQFSSSNDNETRPRKNANNFLIFSLN